MKLSVTIITLNEEANIERAISSIMKLADEIIVVDSASSDATVFLAEKLGAVVYQKSFLGYGQQKNYAAGLCQGEWILNLDADEEVSPALYSSLEKIINGSGDESISVYQMVRLNYFCNRPIYHGGWFPDHKARLCRKGRAQWTEPHVHEDLKPLSSSPIGLLEGTLFHYSFPTVKSQIITNTKYASLGAKDLIRKKKRRPTLPEMLIRPFSKFVECYFLKLGFLDGVRGLIIAINAAHSMFMKYSFAYLDEDEK